MATSDPEILYAGMQNVYKSLDGGSNWVQTTASPLVEGSNMILKIAVSPHDPDLLFVSTVPEPFSGDLPPRVWKSIDGGLNFTQMYGLPDRMASGIAFDPLNSDIVYVTFLGFGTNHLYQTLDGGLSWAAIDNGLPDLPTNTVVVDPNIPDNIYVGNDIGVYVSEDFGMSWELFSADIPDAIMVMHLSISPANRKLRVATHGNGVYQADLRSAVVSTSPQAKAVKDFEIHIFPNPAVDIANVYFQLPEAALTEVRLLNSKGQMMREFFIGKRNAGNHDLELNLSGLAAGIYVCQVKAGNITQGAVMVKQ